MVYVIVSDTTMNNTSPLRYPGGKTRACKILDDIMQRYFINVVNTQTYVLSPFFGGGSFEFHLQNTYGPRILANDKFTPLYTFWNTCKNANEELCNKIQTYVTKVDKHVFTEMRERVMEETNSIMQSCMYFIINRCSFSGATLSGGFSVDASTKRFTQSSIDRVHRLDLRYIDFYNLDCIDFLEEALRDDNVRNYAFLFLDPPYYFERSKSKLYGNKGDMHEHFDHDRLCVYVKSLGDQIPWMMTDNNCAYIRNLYRDYKIVDASWSYGMNTTKTSSEIVILSIMQPCSNLS